MIDNEIKVFKEKLTQTEKTGLALDIDETLSWTVGYWMEQMMERFGNPENLSPREMVTKYRYTQLVPYWDLPEAKEWMETLRESDELQESLPLIENAHHVVQQIDKIIPIVGYITTRPQTVLSGTRKWLKKHDFPQLDILARPADVPHTEGNRWKAEALHFLYPQVRGIIDDNPGLIDHLPNDYQGTIYLYDNEEALRGDIKVVPCKTWNDVHTQVKLLHGVA